MLSTGTCFLPSQITMKTMKIIIEEEDIQSIDFVAL